MAEFLEACKSGDLEKIRALKAEGVDVQSSDSDGLNGLHLAALLGQWKLIKPLL
jgi:hypothetical protein